jgi:hypothetical protein
MNDRMFVLISGVEQRIWIVGFYSFLLVTVFPVAEG